MHYLCYARAREADVHWQLEAMGSMRNKVLLLSNFVPKETNYCILNSRKKIHIHKSMAKSKLIRPEHFTSLIQTC